MKYWKDRTGELKKYVAYWLKKDKRFFQLNQEGKLKVNILLCYRSENEWDRDSGQAVVAKSSKLGPKVRDLYGYDFQIMFAHNLWSEMSKKQRLRTVWHELNHLQVEYDEEGAPIVDGEGRLKLWLLQHDLSLRTFKEEVDKFGLRGDQVPLAKYVGSAYRKSRNG